MQSCSESGRLPTGEVCSLKMASSATEFIHKTVLRDRTVELIAPVPGAVYVDATLGLGGHSAALLDACGSCRVIGIDQDAEAISISSEALARYGDRLVAVRSNFEAIDTVLDDLGIDLIDGIVADLGVSSMQLDDAGRGFSFRTDSALDMRMDRSAGIPTAAELLRDTDEKALADIIYQYGEERRSRIIARRIAERNAKGTPIETTADLAELVEKAIGRRPGDKIHPATRTFQAIRIAVNREIELLEGFLTNGIGRLRAGGVFAVISFHSLEDRIVKRTFGRLSGKCTCPPRMPKCVCGAVRSVEILTKKPITPDQDEVAENPRARSAKLRACRKL